MAQSSEPGSVSTYAETDVMVENDPFGGPGSVGGTIEQDNEAGKIAPFKTDFFKNYFAFKQKIKNSYGLSFGSDYTALILTASDSLDNKTAASGALRIFGQWMLIGRGSEDTGMIVYKAENRHRLGTDIAPKDLGFETGYIGLTAVSFSDIRWALTNLYWDQHLQNNRVAFVAGVLDCTDYFDVYGLVDSWTAFNNLAFSTNPTIPAPNQGLGAAMRLMATPNVYIGGGLSDANGDPTEAEDFFNTFFDDGEYFTFAEVGWVPAIEKQFTDNIHLSAWHVDERKKAGVPGGRGMAVSASRLFSDTWQPFLRAGFADDGGAMWERSISVGLGYYTQKTAGLIGIGLNWSRPSSDAFGSGLDDQYTTEVFYRFQLLKFFTITPGIQVLFNPALNPNDDVIGIYGVRGRINF